MGYGIGGNQPSKVEAVFLCRRFRTPFSFGINFFAMGWILAPLLAWPFENDRPGVGSAF
jgi:hypothetical protein